MCCHFCCCCCCYYFWILFCLVLCQKGCCLAVSHCVTDQTQHLRGHRHSSTSTAAGRTRTLMQVDLKRARTHTQWCNKDIQLDEPTHIDAITLYLCVRVSLSDTRKCRHIFTQTHAHSNTSIYPYPFVWHKYKCQYLSSLLILQWSENLTDSQTHTYTHVWYIS